MQDTRHPIRRALETQEAANARRVSALPPVKDPEMQAWLSPLSVSAVDRAPMPTPTVSRIQSGNTMRGVGMSAIGALAIAALTYSMLPQDQLPTPDLMAANAIGLEGSVVPAAGTTGLTDAVGVEEIERLLQAIAFAPGTIDGYLDSKTEDAIKEFEKAAGREPTGQPTVALLEELRAVSHDLGRD
jgi:peptidoglycan hydrolase-like protein with peptidoglycan-binding domain